MQSERQDHDPITPTQIEHSVDEIWDGDKLSERYNFIDYHFEERGAYLRARTYTDEIQTATLFGPFEKRGSVEHIAAPDVVEAAMTYLRRRFRDVKRLGPRASGSE